MQLAQAEVVLGQVFTYLAPWVTTQLELTEFAVGGGGVDTNPGLL
jgi:hypothetical protein